MHNKLALVHVIVLHRAGDKSSPESKLAQDICRHMMQPGRSGLTH